MLAAGNALFFAGDLGQRIFQQPFSWKALGVDIRGRSRTLRVNYRTSHLRRMRADRLLGPEISDVDGNPETRRHAISVFNGQPPVVRSFPSADAEIEAVSNCLSEACVHCSMRLEPILTPALAADSFSSDSPSALFQSLRAWVSTRIPIVQTQIADNGPPPPRR